MGSADLLTDATIVANAALTLAKQSAIMESDALDLLARIKLLPETAIDLRIGPRQIVDCEWTATPMDQITACLGAGCLVLVFLGAAGANKATWRAVEVVSWDGKVLKAKQLYEANEFVIANPAKAITRIVYWTKSGG